MTEAIIGFWPILLSGFFSIVWFVRLEAKVLYLEKSKDKDSEKLDAMQIKLDHIAESLARLEGKFESNARV